jgi:transcriptional regulator with GAF, ATPase, and Fis domain
LPEEYQDRYLQQRMRQKLLQANERLAPPEIPEATQIPHAKPELISVWQVPGSSQSWASVGSGVASSVAPSVDSTVARDPVTKQWEADDNERSLNYLLEVNKRMVSERDPERLLEFILDTAIELAGTEEGLLLQPDNQDCLQVRHARNFKRVDSDEYRLSESIAQQVFSTGEPVFSLNAMQESQWQAFESVMSQGLMTVVCFPIKIHHRVTGVIYLATKKQLSVPPQLFRILQAFADLAALGLHNAELFQSEAILKERLSADLSLSQQKLEEQSVYLRKLESEVQNKERDTTFAYENIIGRSAKMEKVLKTLDRVTNAQVPVHVFGETGTGKELMARALHENSYRSNQSFVAINCSAFTETLLESELFGYVKGAFTGADRDRKGLFEQAHQGTLFLDEVADMTLSMQAKLLRVLQEQEVRPVGGRQPIKIDVRIVSATNKDLKEQVKIGEFREDLYYRLAGLTLRLPTLSERKDDIPLLVKHLIEKIRGHNKIEAEITVAPDALQTLLTHTWPGNIRELEQVLTNACLFAENGRIETTQLLLNQPGQPAGDSLEPSAASAGILFDPERSLAEYETEIIKRTVGYFEGNKSEAARRLGLARLTLYKKLKKDTLNS